LCFSDGDERHRVAQMNGIFDVRPLGRPGFLRRLFGRSLPRNAYVEIGNLLATRNWNEIEPGDLAELLKKHGAKKFDRAQAERLLAKAVKSFVSDEVLADSEIVALQRLRDLFGISDKELREITKQIVHPIYRKALDAALNDQDLTEWEREWLESLRKGLRLDESEAREMWDRTAKPVFDQRLQRAVQDRRLDPDELASLDALAKNFHISVDVNSANHEQLARFRWFWLMENGTFPEVPAPIALQKKEICHFSASTTLYEMRTETVRVNYSGPSARIRIMKGVYYRVGSVQAQRVTRDVLREIDTGTLYVTNKRILFDGSRKNMGIRLANVFAILPYSDAVEIEKVSGRNPIFTVPDPEWLGILLSSLLAHAN
jgi:hypothetical protein